jgi:hypothetical protein
MIGTRLGLTVAIAMNIDNSTTTFWTDSTNSLYWINSPSSELKFFVVKRVGEVHMLSKPCQWRHIPTDLNPADIPTRLPKISDLARSKLWWKGPRFLYDSMTSWPKPLIPPKEIDDEAKDDFKKLFTGQIDIAQQGLLDPSKFSFGEVWEGYDQLLSLATLIFKLANPKRDYSRVRKIANRFLVRRSQQNNKELSKVSEQLRSGGKVSKLCKSFLPFLDESGILRLKSRLANVDYLAYEVRYPVLLRIFD